MKQKNIWIFYVDINEQEFEKFKNSIFFDYKNSKLSNFKKINTHSYTCVFYDSFKNKNVEVLLDFLSIDNIKKNHIDQIVTYSLNQAKQLSSENMGKEKNENSISDLIYRNLENTYYWNLDESKPRMNSILLCAKIFFEILNQHLLTNGNKRMATMILMNLLYFFGFYFKWSKGLYQDYSINKDIISEFVEEYQNNKNEEQAILKIYEWINQNIVIGLNFRN